MGHLSFNRPLKSVIKKASVVFLLFIWMHTTQAEVLNLPLKRSIATQPISKLEIIAAVKSVFSGRVLSIKKKSTYTNPDCHHVRFLEDRGEFQLISVGCMQPTIRTKKKV